MTPVFSSHKNLPKSCSSAKLGRLYFIYYLLEIFLIAVRFPYSIIFLVALIGLGLGVADTPLLATPASDILITGFTIRQETSVKNGVLVSRPRQLDEQIRFLIQTNHINSLESLSAWLTMNFSFQDDIGGDNWATPEETLAKRAGDCEDFAFLTRAALKVLGYDPKVIVLRRDKKAHATCVFQSDGYYCWFDNTELKKTSAQSLKEFVQEMTAQYHLTAMLELDPERKEWSVIYQRT